MPDLSTSSKNPQSTSDPSQTPSTPEAALSPAAKVRQEMLADISEMSEAKLNALVELAVALAKLDRKR